MCIYLQKYMFVSIMWSLFAAGWERSYNLRRRVTGIIKANCKSSLLLLFAVTLMLPPAQPEALLADGLTPDRVHDSCKLQSLEQLVFFFQPWSLMPKLNLYLSFRWIFLIAVCGVLLGVFDVSGLSAVPDSPCPAAALITPGAGLHCSAVLLPHSAH